MLFEINKIYKDYGEYALYNDNELINNLNENDILSFVKSLKHEDIFIGGCCGFGIKEMEKLFDILKNIIN